MCESSQTNGVKIMTIVIGVFLFILLPVAAPAYIAARVQS